MDVLFIIGNWNAKVESQQISGVTGKFALGVQIEARQRLTEFCQENALLIEDTLPNSIRDNSTHGHHHVVNTKIRLTTFFAAKDGEALYSQKKKKRVGADYGSEQELLIAKFRLKLKKVEKATRPFRYDLNQIPHDYTVEARNRFKGLGLIDGVHDEL